MAAGSGRAVPSPDDPAAAQQGAGRRVAFFLHGLEAAGAQRRTLQLAGALAGFGDTVDLLVVDASGPFFEEVSPEVGLVVLGGPFVRAPWVRDKRRRRVAAVTPALVRYLRAYRPEVFVAAANHVHFAAIAAHGIAGVTETALVLRVTNALIAGRPGLNSALRRAAARVAYGRADGVAANSPLLAQEVAALSPTLGARVRFVADPVVDDQMLALAQGEPCRPWPTNGPVVLAAGRLTAQKDCATLLRAFALLRQRRPAHLLLLGEGPDRTALERLVADLGLEGAVSLPGFTVNPFSYMRRANVLALSSRWEGLPGVLVEAMALGCPVVSTDTPGPRTLLDDGRLGRLTPVGDAEALAEALAHTLDHPPDPDALRRASRAYCVDITARAFAGLLDAAVTRTRSAANPAKATRKPLAQQG